MFSPREHRIILKILPNYRLLNWEFVKSIGAMLRPASLLARDSKEGPYCWLDVALISLIMNSTNSYSDELGIYEKWVRQTWGRYMNKAVISAVHSSATFSRLICETPELFSGGYARFWSPLLQALVGLFELPEDDSTPDDEHFIDIEDTPGYQVGSEPVFLMMADYSMTTLNT
jgi:hypothetical protein